MSKFKVGDTAQSIATERRCVIRRIVPRDGSDFELWGLWGNDTIEGWDFASRCLLVNSCKGKTKPTKPHTETDRRKAAKAVRELRAKLAKACAKAKETGIKINFVNASIGMIDIEMTYQPETPKMRKY